MLVSCIMPTYARRAFVPRAVACFLAQQGVDDLELLILDDAADAVRDLIPDHSHIRYWQSAKRLTVGAKRNLLCGAARGEIIVHWDDDDWYSEQRVQRQVEAMMDPALVASGSSTIFYYDAAAGAAFQYRYAGPYPFVTGNTLAYRKAFWEKCPFADVNVGEDIRFMRKIPRAQLADLRDPTLCVAAFHPRNVSPKRPAGPTWLPVEAGEVRRLLGSPRFDISADGAGGPSAPGAEWPLVTCIMPTADRRAAVQLALRLYAAQDYPSRELVVVDCGQDTVADLCQDLSGVRYLRATRPITIGAMRNLACEHASGEIIAHWDDDDWYGPDRLRRQVESLRAGRADVSGLVAHHVLTTSDGGFWAVTPALHRRMFVGDVHGGTLVYRRSYFAQGLRYPECDLAEDALLLKKLLSRGARLERLSDHDIFVYVRHARNAWRFEPGRFLDRAGWLRSERPASMSAELVESYRVALSPGAGSDRGQAPTLREVVPARSPALPVEVTPTPRAAVVASAPASALDCLGVTFPLPGQARIACRRCIAFVASESHAQLLDTALETLGRFGCVADALRVVLVANAAPAVERVAACHGASVLHVTSHRPASPALKAALYSLAAHVEASQYLCLDTDVLILDSLASLFDQHAQLGPGQVLIAAEAARVPIDSLERALSKIYHASAAEIAALTGADAQLQAYPRIVNDGVFVADGEALMAIDRCLRAAPGLVAWVHARADVSWRQKAALNIALARLGCGAVLDQAFNVQLHVEHVAARRAGERCEPLWRGQRARVLHFNGAGRAAHRLWRDLVLGPRQARAENAAVSG
jgi:glycosyltransferase involved in cell wall biosynthesis